MHNIKSYRKRLAAHLQGRFEIPKNWHISFKFSNSPIITLIASGYNKLKQKMASALAATVQK
jgi:hypothetical protein